MAKVRFGLKNVHYSVVTMSGNTPSFATPKALPGAVSVSLEAQGDSTDFYADDTAYFSRYANNGYEGTLEIAQITEDFLADCLGQKTDINGVIVESSEDNPAYFALLFEFTTDDKAIRHCMYYCTASRPTQAGETKKDSLEVKTEELKFKVVPLPGTGIIKSRTSADTDQARYDAWFTAVELPDFEELTVTPKTAQFDGTADVSFTVTGGTVDAIKKGGTALASTDYSVSSNTVLIKASYLTGLSNGKHKFVMYSGTNNVAVTITK